MQIFLIIDLSTFALLTEYDKIKLMLDKLTHTFKKHFYYFLENFGVLKCFIAFLEEFCSPPIQKMPLKAMQHGHQGNTWTALECIL